jgi:hypothetical protein
VWTLKEAVGNVKAQNNAKKYASTSKLKFHIQKLNIMHATNNNKN